MEDLSPFLSNTFMSSLYKKIQSEYSQEKLNDIIKKMIQFYQLKQKNIIFTNFEKKRHDFPFSYFNKDEMLKSELDGKSYQELLAIIVKLDSNHPIFEQTGNYVNNNKKKEWC